MQIQLVDRSADRDSRSCCGHTFAVHGRRESHEEVGQALSGRDGRSIGCLTQILLQSAAVWMLIDKHTVELVTHRCTDPVKQGI